MDMALGVGGIARSNGLRNLRNGDRNGLAGDAGFKLQDGRFEVRTKAGNVQNTVLVRLFEFLQDGNLVLIGMVVDKLVALRAEQHQVGDIVDVGRPKSLVTAGSVLLEGHDVRHLRKISRRERERVFEKIVVAAVEFTTAPRAHKQQQALEITNAAADVDDGRRCWGDGGSGARFVLLGGHATMTP